MRLGEIWEVDTNAGRQRVLVASIGEANERFGVAVVLMLHPAEAIPDTVLSVVLSAAEASAFAMNLTQLRAERFSPDKGAVRLGSATDVEMDHVRNALRRALDL